MSRTAQGGLIALLLGLLVGLMNWAILGCFWGGLVSGAAVAALALPPMIYLTRSIR